MCGENSRRHAARNHLPGEEQRRAGAQRSRARRFARRNQSAYAVETQQAAARTLAGVAGHDLGGEQAGQPLAAEQDEGHVSVAGTWRLALDKALRIYAWFLLVVTALPAAARLAKPRELARIVLMRYQDPKRRKRARIGGLIYLGLSLLAIPFLLRAQMRSEEHTSEL